MGNSLIVKEYGDHARVAIGNIDFALKEGGLSTFSVTALTSSRESIQKMLKYMQKLEEALIINGIVPPSETAP